MAAPPVSPATPAAPGSTLADTEDVHARVPHATRAEGTDRLEERPTEVLRGPWHPAPLVATLARHSPEQRATLLAAGFAVLSAVWAPIGIALFLQRRFTLFLVVSVVAAALLVAPRPSLLRAPGALRTVAREVRTHVVPAVHEARVAAARAARTVHEGAGPAVAALRERGVRARAWTEDRLEDLGSRARVRAAAWRDAGERSGARSTRRDPQLSDPLSRWIGG